MSFLSILKKIGTVVMGVEHVAAPIAETLFPAFSGPINALDNIFQKLQSTIVAVEVNNPASGQGASKANAVVADFEAGLQFTQSILAGMGQKLTYDEAALQTAIAAQVAAFNAMAAVKASFKVVPLG